MELQMKILFLENLITAMPSAMMVYLLSTSQRKT